MLHSKRPIEARFIGACNYVSTDGSRSRGWEIRCCRCGLKTVVVSNSGHSLPPKSIIKKLTRAGWSVGNKPADDVCPSCLRIRKEKDREVVKSRVDLAKVALDHLQAPVVANGERQMHYAELATLALKLEPDQKRQLMRTLRESLPHEPPRPKPAPPPRENESEYGRWLEQEESEQNEQRDN